MYQKYSGSKYIFLVLYGDIENKMIIQEKAICSHIENQIFWRSLGILILILLDAKIVTDRQRATFS